MTSSEMTSSGHDKIWALQALGVTHIISVAAVGGITPDTMPGYLVCPDQIIDYTYGREQSFFSDDFSAAKHIDFTYPYNQELREKIMTASKERGLDLIDRGVYGTTQGPRLESGAEIIKMAKDGCTIVGMTGMIYYSNSSSVIASMLMSP